MTHPDPVVVQDSGVPEVEQKRTEELCGAVFPMRPGQEPCGKPKNHATEAPDTDWKRDYHSNGLLKWRVDGADLPYITPAEERTGVSDVQHAVLGEVAALREDLAPMREMAWTERHNGIGPTLMLQIDARLDRIEQWARGGQR